jgi:hypothetical protein
MRELLYVLIKSLAVPFYKRHAGVLLFVFFLMFGIVESSQIVEYHLALIGGMLNSEVFFAIVLAVWTLYSLKALHFLISTIRQEPYNFLHHLSVLPVGFGFLLFFAVSAFIFLPVIIYTTFIYSVAFQNHYYTIIIFIALFQASLCSINGWALTRLLHTASLPPFITVPSFTLPHLKSQFSFYIGYIFKEGKTSLLLSKMFSLTLLYIIRETLEPGDDFRIIGLTWVFVLLSHTFLVQRLKIFEDQHLAWIRGFPISFGRTFIMYVQLYGLLMLPELMLITASLWRGIFYYEYLLLPLYSGGLLTLIHTYLFKPDRNPERFTSYLFWLFMLCFMLVLGKLIVLVTAGVMVLSFILLRKRYRQYEPVV